MSNSRSAIRASFQISWSVSWLSFLAALSQSILMLVGISRVLVKLGSLLDTQVNAESSLSASKVLKHRVYPLTRRGATLGPTPSEHHSQIYKQTLSGITINQNPPKKTAIDAQSCPEHQMTLTMSNGRILVQNKGKHPPQSRRRCPSSLRSASTVGMLQGEPLCPLVLIGMILWPFSSYSSPMK
ncbi:uncharacterized protein BDZ99DRAFT_201172 [Mytilinidion resinicola]|uniref:Uncharacterized protein n=1 Tax=Mytilinidion resinicola TaxID=574789 RepID=A0A6A6Y285_9PEZI|nr:uncharacterized protein BDZ99DRAFT_201172 [Mytilinidion resinicola]KAF2802623.1 hypothetical protein BDZ99DRAFT_201172 [Mytilinidion resinicola]